MFAITPRLLLRPGWREDAPALFRAICDEGIVRNLAQAPWPYSFADAESFLMRERAPHEPTCLVFLRTAGAPLLAGAVGLARKPGERETELGYWIARPFWGHGIATEAARALIANARESLRLNRLVAGHFTDNPASGAVLRKLGFRSLGKTIRRYSAGRGEEVACREFALDLREEPEAFGPRAIAA
ncbi:MAG: GNAT family N-acetyltransferase [Alphaproteobacteria bacterium]|nr:MAG: GNAT family N-acetyltransferase [Alphaproteobacteria bacterium]